LLCDGAADDGMVGRRHGGGIPLSPLYSQAPAMTEIVLDLTKLAVYEASGVRLAKPA
jgi:hypothetical protein